jgi:hypothetical protein
MPNKAKNDVLDAETKLDVITEMALDAVHGRFQSNWNFGESEMIRLLSILQPKGWKRWVECKPEDMEVEEFVKLMSKGTGDWDGGK